jgi:two-component sensor histidine kinase
MVHSDDLSRALAANRRCIEEGQDLLEVEYRMRAKNGEWRWIYSRGKCVERDAQGRGTRLVGTHVDMTDRRTTEEQLKRNLVEKEVLLREVHHRVKNNLNIISSLLNLQSSMIRSPADAMSAFENSRDRIMAMSLVHEKLYQSSNYAQVNMQEYVGTLVSQLTVAYGQGRPVRLVFDAAGVFLDVNTSIPCGLIMNELITNAFKYAFPDNREGAISITMHKSASRAVELDISDDGVGMPADVAVERADSLGLTLVRMLVEQLDGSILVTSEHGTSFHIQFSEAS